MKFQDYKFIIHKDFNKIKILEPIGVSKDSSLNYVLFSNCEEPKPTIKDKNGIPMFQFKGFKEILYYHLSKLKKAYYHPVVIAAYGLEEWNMWKRTGDNIYLDKFFSSANWLTNNVKIFKNKRTGKEYGLWFYDFDYYLHGLFSKDHKMEAPWISGMAQGQAISVLVRAYNMSQEEKYLNTATLAMNSFLNYFDGEMCDEHWISYIDKDNNNLWIEEYPIQKIKSKESVNFTLNGFIFALIGIYDYYLVTENKEAKRLYQMGVKTIYNNIEKYISTTDSKSYYCLRHKVILERYHLLHINQLKLIYRQTKIKFFNYWADKFKELDSKSKKTQPGE